VSDPERLRVTCIAHASHRVCETIVMLYPIVDKPVASGNKLFVKPSAGTEFFRNTTTDTPLPSTLIITVRITQITAK
jgi:hypothetical protein